MSFELLGSRYWFPFLELGSLQALFLYITFLVLSLSLSSFQNSHKFHSVSLVVSYNSLKLLHSFCYFFFLFAPLTELFLTMCEFTDPFLLIDPASCWIYLVNVSVQLLCSSALLFVWYLFIFNISLLILSLCSLIILLTLVSIFMRLKPLSGKFIEPVSRILSLPSSSFLLTLCWCLNMRQIRHLSHSS